jgi:hypothetical protein
MTMHRTNSANGNSAAKTAAYLEQATGQSLGGAPSSEHVEHEI